MSGDLDFEPIPGLPHDLPPGETIVWQGRPEWRALLRNVFKARWLVAYFGIFATVRASLALSEAQGPSPTVQLVALLGLATTCLVLLAVFAWLNARATVYTITTRRVVLRIGIALPTSWNLPFKRIASAQVTRRPQGDGDVVLQLTAPNRIAWLQLWPHTQPWHFTRARPTLRAIAEPTRVAALLADAVKAWAQAEGAPVMVSAPQLAALPVEATRPLGGGVIHAITEPGA